MCTSLPPAEVGSIWWNDSSPRSPSAVSAEEVIPQLGSWRMPCSTTFANATATLSPSYGPQTPISSSEKYSLGDHLKTGHTLSVQNRPTGLAEDAIVGTA